MPDEATLPRWLLIVRRDRPVLYASTTKGMTGSKSCSTGVWSRQPAAQRRIGDDGIGEWATCGAPRRKANGVGRSGVSHSRKRSRTFGSERDSSLPDAWLTRRAYDPHPADAYP
jgi:hypothetical protein